MQLAEEEIQVLQSLNSSWQNQRIVEDHLRRKWKDRKEENKKGD